MRLDLSEEQLKKSKGFIYKKGRLLERKLFEYFFENGAQQDCLKALAAYQNEDGGFGNGIEPDILCPASSAIGAETAMAILDWLQAQDTDIAQKLVAWIIANQGVDGAIPHPPPNFSNYPCQPWWRNPDPQRVLSLAGMLRKWNLDQPEFFKKARSCYLSLPFPSDIEVYHYPFVIYLKYCAESDADRERLSSIVEHFPSFLAKFSGYFPLYSKYWSFARSFVSQDVLDQQLTNFIRALKDDGGIVTPYPDFPQWDTIFLLDGLIELKADSYKVS